MHFVKYLKTAFLNRWNLLLLAGAMGFALLSGRADVWVPLVLAVEVAYLGLLGTHPKFQAYVDARQNAALREQGTAGVEQMMKSIMAALPPKSLERYEALRARCLELRQIALGIKYPGHTVSASILEQSQLAGLDRLLWIYLRLLFTQYSLERFFQKTSEAQIQQDIDNLGARLEKVSRLKDEAQRQKFTRTIEDNLETCRNRLSNYQKARSNYELIQLEIDRLENKIRSLSELAVNRQEPDFISGQVDQVAASMLETERTMNDLQFATGLISIDETAPQLLPREEIRQQ
ncbi:MAG: hypothetical protein ACUVXJ_07195 [Phycisphaerae bacterium]